VVLTRFGPDDQAGHEREATVTRVPQNTNPPRSLVLAHGAGSGPWIFEGWEETFAGVVVEAVDLHQNLDVAHATHAHFANRVVAAARSLPAPVALCGWSMGGLAVLQAADRVAPHSVVLLETSPPAEAQENDPTAELRPGTFDPEEAYGKFPRGIRARPESQLARAERRRGVSVPRLQCPSLVVVGDYFREERGASVAAVYGSELIDFPGLGHWDLVRAPEVRAAVAEFVGVR
jgi:pimeloyl-ACP methyl ester carboxylesterase